MQFNVSKVRQVLEEQCEVKLNDRILVALSGGADSISLLRLMSQMPFYIEAAHCNFKLRGDESDGDEVFVRNLCDELGVKLHLNSFDTKKVAAQQGISVEMAARDLRYDWFQQLLEMRNLSCIATGHHGNDSIETFFLNLLRGSGVKGLSGIKYRNGNVVRPLLVWSREEIENYCRQREWSYRTDSSNSDTKHLRNKIRHEIIPLFEEVNPSFFQTMQHNMDHIKDAEELLEREVAKVRQEIVVEEHDRLLIPISRLKEYSQRQSLLFELLRPYGFNSSTIHDVNRHLDDISGKQFFSDTHRLIKDRHNLLLTQIPHFNVDHFWLEEGQIKEPIPLKVSIFDRPADFSFSKDSKCVHIDADLVELPLLVRKWQNGDTFQPLGMKGFKKVSDFFIDAKFSIADKEEAWLLVFGEEIVWIMGHRVDERFKVTPRTKRIMEIQLG